MRRLAFIVAMGMGCGDEVSPVADLGVDAASGDLGLSLDAGAVGRDAGAVDLGAPDSHRPDAGPLDAAPIDASPPDAAPRDARPMVVAPVDAATRPPGRRFDEVVFRATHNSYSGGARGAIAAQLDDGVRFIELDLHDNGFDAVGDLRVGHDAPGDEVARGGANPEDDRLRSWLEVVVAWADRHDEHAPITLLLDFKDDLTDNPGPEHGNLGFVNQVIEEVLGPRLFPASAFDGEWPRLEALRGRLLVVLSGHAETRLAYGRDRGERPAVAVDAAGRVVELHDSGSGRLWYWTGQRQGDAVRWVHHGAYDTGADPAVALRDDGWLVEAHTAEDGRRLWYRVGRLGDDYTIDWGPARQYDTGRAPSIAFTGPDTLTEIHLSENTGLAWTSTGRLDTAARQVAWAPAARTDAARFPEHRAGALTVSSVGGALMIAVGDGPPRPIRYRRLGFIEGQPTDLPDLQAITGPFRAGPASATGYVRAARRQGLVTRQWGFNDPDDGVEPAANFPATDTPFADWYRRYTAGLDAPW